MDNRQIGILLMIIGLVTGVFVAVSKIREDQDISLIVQKTGSCYLADGTCLHDRSQIWFIFGGIIAASLLILGNYLVFFDKTHKQILEHEHKMISKIEEVKKIDKEKDEFKAFLAGFKDDEKRVLSAVHEQDGIEQSTLRYRTGISKTSLSLMLKNFEERELISRKQHGKTNKVFLRKKF